MKRIVLMIILAVIMAGCASAVTYEGENHFKIEVKEEETGEKFLLDCHVGITTEGGVTLDSECVGFFEKDGKTIRCSVDIGSDGKPVKEKLSIKQDCEVLIE